MNKYTMAELQRKAKEAIKARDTKDDFRYNILIEGICLLTGMHPKVADRRIERLAKGDKDAA